MELEADTVILAVGQQVDSDLLKKNKIELDAKGFPKINEARETNITNVYVAGDMKKDQLLLLKLWLMVRQYLRTFYQKKD